MTESKGRVRKDTRVLWSPHKMTIKICRKNRRRGRIKRSNTMRKIVRGRCLCLKVMMLLKSELISMKE